MIEISYAIVVWSVAIVFQAAVHYSLKRRKRLQEAPVPAAAAELSSPLLLCGNGSLDGDEPPVFFELLTQTGSEMMNSHRSMQSLIQDKINDEDEYEHAIPSRE